MDSSQLPKLSSALTDFYAPGLEACTFVERAFTLTSGLLSQGNF